MTDQAHVLLDRQITRQGFMRPAIGLFELTAVLFVALLALVWLAWPVCSAERDVR